MLEHWEAIDTDFQRLYGIDLDSGILEARTWRWFRVRVVRLLGEDGSALAQALGIRRGRDATREARPRPLM